MCASTCKWLIISCQEKLFIVSIYSFSQGRILTFLFLPHRYSMGSPDFHSVIYRHSDMNSSSVRLASCGHDSVTEMFQKNLTRAANYFSQSNSVSSSRHEMKRETTPSIKNRCWLNVLGDYDFYTAVASGSTTQERITQAMATLAAIVKQASTIYQSTKFVLSTGQTVQGINFAIKTLRVETSPPTTAPFNNAFIGVQAFLDYWSQADYSKYCLSYRFTYRQFDQGVIGLAYVAAPGSLGMLKNGGSFFFYDMYMYQPVSNLWAFRWHACTTLKHALCFRWNMRHISVRQWENPEHRNSNTPQLWPTCPLCCECSHLCSWSWPQFWINSNMTQNIQWLHYHWLCTHFSSMIQTLIQYVHRPVGSTSCMLMPRTAHNPTTCCSRRAAQNWWVGSSRRKVCVLVIVHCVCVCVCVFFCWPWLCSLPSLECQCNIALGSAPPTINFFPKLLLGTCFQPGDNNCGNGLVDLGEDCDCLNSNSSGYCISDPCCNATSCKMVSGAQCRSVCVHMLYRHMLGFTACTHCRHFGMLFYAHVLVSKNAMFDVNL